MPTLDQLFATVEKYEHPNIVSYFSVHLPVRASKGLCTSPVFSSLQCVDSFQKWAKSCE